MNFILYIYAPIFFKILLGWFRDNLELPSLSGDITSMAKCSFGNVHTFQECLKYATKNLCYWKETKKTHCQGQTSPQCPIEYFLFNFFTFVKWEMELNNVRWRKTALLPLWVAGHFPAVFQWQTWQGQCWQCYTSTVRKPCLHQNCISIYCSKHGHFLHYPFEFLSIREISPS